MRVWIIALASLGALQVDAMDKALLAEIFASPQAFENKVVSICSRHPIDGQTVMVGNMGRSPTVIWLDRPIKSPSGCVEAQIMRAETPSPDQRLADGPIALAGWRLKVLRIL